MGWRHLCVLALVLNSPLCFSDPQPKIKLCVSELKTLLASFDISTWKSDSVRKLIHELGALPKEKRGEHIARFVAARKEFRLDPEKGWSMYEHAQELLTNAIRREFDLPELPLSQATSQFTAQEASEYAQWAGSLEEEFNYRGKADQDLFKEITEIRKEIPLDLFTKEERTSFLEKAETEKALRTELAELRAKQKGFREQIWNPDIDRVELEMKKVQSDMIDDLHKVAWRIEFQQGVKPLNYLLGSEREQIRDLSLEPEHRDKLIEKLSKVKSMVDRRFYIQKARVISNSKMSEQDIEAAWTELFRNLDQSRSSD
jgi:hypothetical protein